jgi:hypothetical protein
MAVRRLRPEIAQVGERETLQPVRRTVDPDERAGRTVEVAAMATSQSLQG